MGLRNWLSRLAQGGVRPQDSGVGRSEDGLRVPSELPRFVREADLPVSMDTLISRLSSADPEERRSAAVRLGRAGSPVAYLPLVQSLTTDSSPAVRAAAAAALGDLGDVGAVADLTAALQDAGAITIVRGVRDWAIEGDPLVEREECLHTVADAAREALARLLRHET